MLINEKVVTFSTLSPLFHASELLAKLVNGTHVIEISCVQVLAPQFLYILEFYCSTRMCIFENYLGSILFLNAEIKSQHII
jgi:hypothetical protein